MKQRSVICTHLIQSPAQITPARECEKGWGGGWGVTVTVLVAGALLCKNKRASKPNVKRFLCGCDSDQSISDSDQCKNVGYLGGERLTEASSTFWCQRYACCVKLLLAGVQTVSQRSFAAWREREVRREWAAIINRRQPLHANDPQQQWQPSNTGQASYIIIIICNKTDVNACSVLAAPECQRLKAPCLLKHEGGQNTFNNDNTWEQQHRLSFIYKHKQEQQKKKKTITKAGWSIIVDHSSAQLLSWAKTGSLM